MAADLAVLLGSMLSSILLLKRNLTFSIWSPRVKFDAGASRRIAGRNSIRSRFTRAPWQVFACIFLALWADIDIEVFRKLVILLTCC